MLIKLSIRQSSLGRETTLIVAILVILDLYQDLITGVYGLLHKSMSLFGLRPECIDYVSELARVYVHGTSIDRLGGLCSKCPFALRS